MFTVIRLPQSSVNSVKAIKAHVNMMQMASPMIFCAWRHFKGPAHPHRCFHLCWLHLRLEVGGGMMGITWCYLFPWSDRDGKRRTCSSTNTYSEAESRWLLTHVYIRVTFKLHSCCSSNHEGSKQPVSVPLDDNWLKWNVFTLSV